MSNDERAYLTRCVEGEGGRAILAIQGYANANTARYFAKEAAHYGRLLLDDRNKSDREGMMNKDKVYSVTVEVKIIVRAISREAAIKQARDRFATSAGLESLQVVDTFCPADGK